jgi:catechol 2,3-dioxygenase
VIFGDAPDGNGVEVLFDLPRSIWEGDVHAALKYARLRPREGPAALQDDFDYKAFSSQTTT